MLHFGEVFSAEIYARNAVVMGRRQRGKEVLKPWVSNGVSFGTFVSLLKEKYDHPHKKSPKKQKARADIHPLSLYKSV